MEQATLKEDERGYWYIHAPKGHRIGGPFRGTEYKAMEWAKKFVSSWQNLTVRLESKDDAQNDRIPE